MLRKITIEGNDQVKIISVNDPTDNVGRDVFIGTPGEVDSYLKSALAAELTRDLDTPESSDVLVGFGDAIKAIDESKPGRVGGYLVRWGSPQQRDIVGEYFTKDTNFHLDWFKERPMLYHHGLNKALKATVIGYIDTLEQDDEGIWAEGELDLSKKYVKKVLELVGKGVLGWSSGSMKHLARQVDGRMTEWPIIEGSLTPTAAEFRRTQVAALKSLISGTGDTILVDDELSEASGQGESTTTGSGAEEPVETTAEQTNTDITQQGELTVEQLKTIVGQFVDAISAQMQRQMTPEQRGAAVDSVYSAVCGSGEMNASQQAVLGDQMVNDATKRAEVIGEAIKAVRIQTESVAQDALITEAVKSAFVTAAPANPLKANTGSDANPQKKPNSQFANEITMRTKYSEFDAEDLAYIDTFLGGIHRQQNRQHTMPLGFYKALADKTLKGVQDGTLAIKASSLETLNAIKSNELDHSTQANYGDEWVPDLWLNRLWQRSRMENIIAPQFDMINMPSNPYELPIESTDPTVYKVPETTDETQLTLASSANPIPDSKVGTGKVTLTADKLALRVGFSTEADEDSIIPFAAQARKQAQRAILDALDNVFANGDNTASGNINYDGGTPGGTEKYYVGFKGFLYLPLSVGGTLTVDAGGAAPTLAMLRQVRGKLLNAYASRISELRWFCDFPTYMKLLGIPEFLTVDKYGPSATVMTGELGKIDNIPVLISNEIALSASNGKVSSTGGNNTFGRLALVHTPSFYIGYRRQTTVNVEYLSYYDSYVMTATVRPAFVRRDDTCAALLYDILV